MCVCVCVYLCTCVALMTSRIGQLIMFAYQLVHYLRNTCHVMSPYIILNTGHADVADVDESSTRMMVVVIDPRVHFYRFAHMNYTSDWICIF